MSGAGSRPVIRVNHDVTLPLGSDTTWGEILSVAHDAGVPESARVSTRVTPGDRPWESESVEIQFSWTTGDQVLVDNGRAMSAECRHRYTDGTTCTLRDHSAPGIAKVHNYPPPAPKWSD